MDGQSIGKILGVRVGSEVYCAECFDNSFENIRPDRLITEDDPEPIKVNCGNCQQPMEDWER